MTVTVDPAVIAAGNDAVAEGRAESFSAWVNAALTERVAKERALAALADAPLVESWSGHRPGTPDGMPVLGLDPDLSGLVYATGHYRNGILLAPATATAIADLLEGRSHVSFDDIRAMAAPVLRHRILTNYRAEAEGITVEAVIRKVIELTPEK